MIRIQDVQEKISPVKNIFHSFFQKNFPSLNEKQFPTFPRSATIFFPVPFLRPHLCLNHSLLQGYGTGEGTEHCGFGAMYFNLTGMKISLFFSYLSVKSKFEAQQGHKAVTVMSNIYSVKAL